MRQCRSSLGSKRKSMRTLFVGILCSTAANGYVLSAATHELAPSVFSRAADVGAAAANTRVIQQAIDAAKDGDTVVVPGGHYVVETLVIQGKKDFVLRGKGRDATTLIRQAMSWDNDVNGICPGIGVLLVKEVHGFELADMALDGNAPRMAIKGRGRFGEDGRIVAGTPQFPECHPEGTAVNGVAVVRSTDVNVHDMAFRDGFRWCVHFGQVKRLSFVGNVINTGRLYGFWNGHADEPGGVVHCHTSQDGLHLVNVVDATIQWNTIRSEDSAVAIEANPAWDWYAFPGDREKNLGTRDIRVLNNELTTNSDAHRGDIVRGRGLGDAWIGQGCVDIFYNEHWDIEGKSRRSGRTALIRDVTVSGNRLADARHGVRAGIFRNAGPRDASSPAHRIQGLVVEGNATSARAGVQRNAPGGMERIMKDFRQPDIVARHGGVAVLVHHADEVRISGNTIANVTGGTGIELVDVTRFRIVGNQIRNVRGTSLADALRWDGGEGIRVWNPPGPAFDAAGFEIINNRISDTASYAIFMANTANGICPRGENETARWVTWPGQESRSIFLRGCDRVAD
jgi:hypothetical protein